LPSAKIGMPPGDATTPGSVITAGPLLAITSAKTRVVRRYMAPTLAFPWAMSMLADCVFSMRSK
jgi:hypothetical protein